MALAAKKDDGGEEGAGDGSLMTPAELRAALKQAERKPARCAIAVTKGGRAVIVTDRHKGPRKTAADMKAQARAAGLDLDLTSVRFGRVSAAGGVVAITVNKDVPPAAVQKLKPVMRAAGHPKFTINADPAIEDEPEDGADQDGAAGAGRGAPGQVPAPGAALAAAAAPADRNGAAANGAAAPARPWPG